MKKQRKANILRLGEVPEEGATYNFTDETGELNETLKDIVGQGSYSFSFNILPMGDNTFQAQGQFTAQLGLICSRCAIDFTGEIGEKFTEILVILANDRPRNSQMAKSKHNISELQVDEPFCTELKDENFNLDDFARELIALAVPLNPTGKANCDNNCENYQKAIKEGWLKSQDSFDSSHPFALLSHLKH